MTKINPLSVRVPQALLDDINNYCGEKTRNRFVVDAIKVAVAKAKSLQIHPSTQGANDVRAETPRQ